MLRIHPDTANMCFINVFVVLKTNQQMLISCSTNYGNFLCM